MFLFVSFHPEPGTSSSERCVLAIVFTCLVFARLPVNSRHNFFFTYFSPPVARLDGKSCLLYV